ncbi:glycosyltransferase family 4 protein [Luteibacter sp. HA06]|jgi:glycosyltransferase involved in cell wall biosynthesis
MPNIRGNSGSDVFIERLAEGLRRRGVVVTIDWFNRPYEFLPEALVFQRMPSDVDIIHSNGLNAFAFRRHGVPLVVSEHHYVLDPAYRPYKTIVQHAYQLAVTGRASKRSFSVASTLVSPSRFTERVLQRAAPNTRQVMIPLWVDAKHFSPGCSAIRDGAAHDPFRLLFVGNRSFRKGADVIPRLAELLGSGFEILCTGGLRGGGEVAGAGAIRHLGRLSTDQLVEAYRDCDAVLVPSRYEGFGYAALEAMACAKPVIAFACGAVDEIIAHQLTGFMVAVDDVQGMACAAQRLATEPGLAGTMGRAGRERALAHFSEEKGVDAYIDLYNDLRDVHDAERKL